TVTFVQNLMVALPLVSCMKAMRIFASDGAAQFTPAGLSVAWALKLTAGAALMSMTWYVVPVSWYVPPWVRVSETGSRLATVTRWVPAVAPLRSLTRASTEQSPIAVLAVAPVIENGTNDWSPGRSRVTLSVSGN